MQQEREKTSKTQALIDHDPKPQFVLNIYSIHNHKSILAVTPPGLRVHVTSIDVDVVALRTKAAQLVQGEHTDEVNPHCASADELTSGSLPFDQTRGNAQAASRTDVNTMFTGTLSSQSKMELLRMAAVLAIPTTEKDRKQELTLKIRDHLEANPDTRNNAQFGRLTWRSANRSKTSVIPTPPSGTPHRMAMPSFIASHLSFLQLGAPRMPFSVAGLPATGHPVPSIYGHLMTPAPYPFPPSHIPSVGEQQNAYDVGPVPVAYQGRYPGA